MCTFLLCYLTTSYIYLYPTFTLYDFQGYIRFFSSNASVSADFTLDIRSPPIALALSTLLVRIRTS